MRARQGWGLARSACVRYVDDVVVFVIGRSCLSHTTKLSSVYEKILFTAEEEEDLKLLFLDILNHRSTDGLHFSVYRKPDNKDDYINYCSAHSNKTKLGVVIGFYLRSLRICSPEFPETDIAHIINSSITHIQKASC